MKATLDALDERLHGLLTRPCGRAARIVCAALTAFGFALVMATRTLALGHPMATAAALCVPLAAMIIFAMRIAKEHEQGVLGALLLCALCAAAMLARVSFLERSSGDYDIYLADWLQKLAGGSFAEGMRQNHRRIQCAVSIYSVYHHAAVRAVALRGEGGFLHRGRVSGGRGGCIGAEGRQKEHGRVRSGAAPADDRFKRRHVRPVRQPVRGLCAVGTGACAGRKARARGGEFCAVAGV